MKNKKSLQQIRKGVQIFAIILTVLGVFNGFSWFKGLFVITTLLMGPVFCGWVCPFGTIQDIMSKLGRTLHIKRRTMPVNVSKALKPLRYILLALSVFVSADFIFTLFSFDPRSNFETFLNGNAIAIAGWAVIGTFMIISLFYERPFCNTLCIEGARYGLIGAVRPFTVVRNTESCVSCGKCDSVCPMQIDISGHEQVRSLQCINCMNCVSSCPVSNTLSVKTIPIKTTKQKVIVGLIALCVMSGIAYTVNNGDNSSSYAQSTDSITSITGTSDVVGGDATGVADGTYTGTGTGYRGEMTVAVTVEDEIITAIEIVSSSDDSKWLNQAYSGVASDIISEQTADVDTVSGATYSSMGIKEAVADALVNAGSSVAETIENDTSSISGHSESNAFFSNSDDSSDAITTETDDGSDATTTDDSTEALTSDSSAVSTSDSNVVGGAATGVADGTYTGTGTGFRGDMTVSVTVEDEIITAIEIVSTSDDARWFNQAYSVVAYEIIDEQTANVDTATGATYSSVGIKQAVANALINAGSTTQDEIESTLPTGGGHGHR